MLRYSRPNVVFPSILNLESKDEDIRDKETKKAQETLIKLDNEDKEKNNPSFFNNFLEGFAAPYKFIWNTGEKL